MISLVNPTEGFHRLCGAEIPVQSTELMDTDMGRVVHVEFFITEAIARQVSEAHCSRMPLPYESRMSYANGAMPLHFNALLYIKKIRLAADELITVEAEGPVIGDAVDVIDADLVLGEAGE
ncbi:hypothetical protein [Leptolyngbya sp. FACHB-16]|uniref:hypothetical protein n=1 Tax=unclassified Leptolyngbya TaxID=2650499 RepID=UPI001683BC02|nr:hypothetical protein [Leptolyngbya sp. FACHB-16]MBD2156223.1 hypothetical protein [Leptolyngbya sp. FACHB-16]